MKRLLLVVHLKHMNKPKLLLFLDFCLLFKVYAGRGKAADHFCKARVRPFHVSLKDATPD